MDASTDLGQLLKEGLPIAAVFVDVENMAVDRERGLMDFDIDRVMQYVQALSRPVVRRAYADWFRLRTLRAPFLRAGFDQVQTTYINRSKNSLDMQLCVDAMETLVTNPDIRVVFLLSADSDFSSLSRGLRRHNRMVIGIGWAEKTNPIFRNNCDSFLAYDSLPPLERAADEAAEPSGRSAGGRGRSGRSGRGGRPETSRGGRAAGPPAADSMLQVEGSDGPGEPEVAFEGGGGRPARRGEEGEGAGGARPLSDLDPAIARLMLDHGPGAVLSTRGLISGLKRYHEAANPRRFGLNNLGQLIDSHPLLRRAGAIGAEVRLPHKLPLTTLGPPPAEDREAAVAAAVAALSAMPVGFLGRERQYRVLRALHRAYRADGEPFARRDLIDQVAATLEDVSAEEVARVDRIVWNAKSFAVADRRGGRDPLAWPVSLREDYRDFDALQFQHDSELVREGLSAGAVLDSRGWAVLIDGDEDDAADFADMLLELGFVDPAFAAAAGAEEDEDDEVAGPAVNAGDGEEEGDTGGDDDGDDNGGDETAEAVTAAAGDDSGGHHPARPTHVPQSPRFGRAHDPSG